MKRIRLLIAMVAGVVSVTAPLPYLVLPGVFLAALIWPEGIHAGEGVEYFGQVALALNFFVFALVFYALASLMTRRKKLNRSVGD